MPTFIGPVAFTRTLVSPDPLAWARNPGGQRLLSHYGSQAEGVNVYMMADGRITTDEPSNDEWSNGLVRHVLFGAHCEPVTDAEVTALTAAGFGAYVHDGDYTDIYADLYTDSEDC